MKASCIAIVLFLLTAPLLRAQSTDETSIQPFYDKVVRLKDGSILRDVEVTHEVEGGKYERYIIKKRDGAIVTKLPSEILVIETHARTLFPPRYHPIDIVFPCDDRQRELQWYFAELRGWVMATGEDQSDNTIGLEQLTFGPELAAGWRVHPFGIGVGVSYFTARDIARTPVFLHARWQLSTRCFAPFLYAQLGTVFDDQSDTGFQVRNTFSPAPKILGAGIGIDYPIAPWLDISVDLGYRYLQLPTRVPCDCSDQEPLYEAVYFNESHSVLLRVGATF
jgi:hypothetical protein